jgi:hypothetical protein
VVLLRACIGAKSTLLVQEYGDEAPKFDDDGRQASFAQLQESHRVLMAVQALSRELRTQLVERKQYAGSKLELMDIFGVKLSELSAWPFYVGRFTRKPLSAGFYDKRSQMRKKFKRNRKVAKKDLDEDEPERARRPTRNAKKRDDDDYVE